MNFRKQIKKRKSGNYLEIDFLVSPSSQFVNQHSLNDLSYNNSIISNSRDDRIKSIPNELFAEHVTYRLILFNPSCTLWGRC